MKRGRRRPEYICIRNCLLTRITIQNRWTTERTLSGPHQSWHSAYETRYNDHERAPAQLETRQTGRSNARISGIDEHQRAPAMATSLRRAEWSLHFDEMVGDDPVPGSREALDELNMINVWKAHQSIHLLPVVLLALSYSSITADQLQHHVELPFC